MDKDFLNARLNELRDQNLMYSYDRLLGTFGASDFFNSRQVISFSGGRSSAFMTLELKKLFPDIPVVFCDTGAEHPKTYEFIRKFSKHFKIDIRCIRTKVDMRHGHGCHYTEISINDIGDDLKPFNDMMQKYGTPYVTGAFCTDRMKDKPFKNWCKDYFNNEPYRIWIGLRIDQPTKFNRLREERFLYLADISDYEKRDIAYFWKQQPFDLEIADHLGNCVFCIKKSAYKIGLATKDEPEMADKFIKIIEEATPKERNITQDKKIMYRGRTSLEGLKKFYSTIDREKLISKLINGKQFETTCASESCEISD
jgi:hypothetical protein